MQTCVSTREHRTRAHTRTCMYPRTCTNTFMRTHIHTQKYTYIHSCIHTHRQTHMYIYIYVYNTHTKAYMQTSHIMHANIANHVRQSTIQSCDRLCSFFLLVLSLSRSLTHALTRSIIRSSSLSFSQGHLPLTSALRGTYLL